MKRLTIALLSIVLMFGFAACKEEKKDTKPSTTKTTGTTTDEAGKKAAQENADILDDYETEAQIIEVPSVSDEKVEEVAKQNGADKVKVNKDGTVEVDMTNEEYTAMMQNVGKTILDKLETIRQSDSMIESVQAGLDFDKYYIFVDKTAYEANPDVIDIKSCCESAEIYQMLNGKKTKDIKITLYIMNKADDLEIARKVYTVK